MGGLGVFGDNDKLISEKGKEHLRNYKYAGVDLSPTYKFILSPFAEFLVQFIPRWIAPNLITLTSLSCSIASAALTMYYNPDIRIATAPKWIFFVNALLLLAYQTLDNMDGKQARRTGNSSPLGLLFDHGCDAINCTFGTMIFAVAIQSGVGSYWEFLFLWLLPAIPFFFATWEELHLHELVLPIVNGPNEGLLMSMAAMTISGVYGSEFWVQSSPTVVSELPFIGVFLSNRRDAYLSIAGVMLVFTVIAQFTKVVRRVGFAGAINTLLPLHLLLLGAFALPLVPGGMELAETYPRTAVILLGAVEVEALAAMMLAHVAHSPYRVLRGPSVLPFLPALNLLLPGGPVVPPAVALQTATILAVLATGTQLYRTVDEITDALGIRCFRVKKYSVA